MVINSVNLLQSFIIKYKNLPIESNSKDYINMKSMGMNIDTQYDFFDDINYTLILSNISSMERKSFIRFFEIFKFRLYNCDVKFSDNNSIDWNLLKVFIKNSKTYKTLLQSCFYYYF